MSANTRLVLTSWEVMCEPRHFHTQQIYSEELATVYFAHIIGNYIELWKARVSHTLGGCQNEFYMSS